MNYWFDFDILYIKLKLFLKIIFQNYADYLKFVYLFRPDTGNIAYYYIGLIMKEKKRRKSSKPVAFVKKLFGGRQKQMLLWFVSPDYAHRA